MFGVIEYNLLLLVIHALFLIFTATAVSLQIKANHAIEKVLEKKKEVRAQFADETVRLLSKSSTGLLERSNLLMSSAKETKVGQNLIVDSVRKVVSNPEEMVKALFALTNELQSIMEKVRSSL